ncbi:MAG TPA: HEAT repeat domain-containing protein, partial [Fibrobacteria bacterium]|nr:HEAT repeat domain-containing protein [Fibrobacteria bacterium]
RTRAMASVWTGKGGLRTAAAWVCLAVALAAARGTSAPAAAGGKPPAAAKKSAGKPARHVAAADSSAFRFVPPVFTHQDSLFIAAATGEPRFKPLRDGAEKELIAGDTLTLDYLLAKRLLDQTPRQRHYVENLFKAVSDSGRNHAPVTRLATALSGAADSVQVQLLHIGSELGDTTFLPVARLYLRHDSVEVRKTAVRSLGTYPAPANAALLLDGLDKTKDLERQARLWALDKQTALKDWPRLLPVLEDGNLYNRQLARRIVARSAGDWAPLERYVPADPDPEEQLEWVLLALETPGPAAKAYVRKALPALDPEPRKFIESFLPRPVRNLRPGPAYAPAEPGPSPKP